MLDIELPDAAVEPLRQLGAGLADAGEDDVLRRHARGERALELAARNDVGAIALPREHAQHAEVGVALDREGDVLLRHVLERVAEHLRMAFRSEERRGGKGCVSTCWSWWSPFHSQHNIHKYT